MPALVCGSLAFDTIATFPGRFADQILANQLHILNVSFLVPTLRREFGGCAGNIAYNLAALGGEPVVLAAVGSDGDEYLARLRSWGATTEHVRPVADSLTAQAIIITDLDNNQITAFHPGAMQAAHETPVPARSDLRLAIIAPDGRDAMLEHAAAARRGEDPVHLRSGPGPADVRRRRALGVRRARQLGRGQRLRSADAVPSAPADRSRRCRARTCAASSSRSAPRAASFGNRACSTHDPGSRRDRGGRSDRLRRRVPGGDALRPREGLAARATASRLGNRLGALKIASRGGQNHVLDRTFAGA